MGRRHQRVRAPEPERRLDRDRPDVEAPWRHEREVVVDPPVDAVAERVGHHLVEDGAVLALLVAVGLGELVRLRQGVDGAARDPVEDGPPVVVELLAQRRLADERQLALADVAGGLAGEPVEPVRVERRDGDDRSAADHTFGQERGAGRTSAGHPRSDR